MTLVQTLKSKLGIGPEAMLKKAMQKSANLYSTIKNKYTPDEYVKKYESISEKYVQQGIKGTVSGIEYDRHKFQIISTIILDLPNESKYEFKVVRIQNSENRCKYIDTKSHKLINAKGTIIDYCESSFIDLWYLNNKIINSKNAKNFKKLRKKMLTLIKEYNAKLKKEAPDLYKLVNDVKVIVEKQKLINTEKIVD